MVLGFGQAFIAAQAQFGQIGAQSGQGFLIQKTTEVVGRKQIDLWLTQAAKQRIVLIGNLLLVATSGHADQLTPGFFQKATRRGGLCHGHAQLTQKGLIGGRIKEGRYQPVQLSAGGFFVHGRRGGRRVQGQVHKG